MDIGTAFGTLGARREMMVGFLAEPALLMVHLRRLADLGDHRAAGDRRESRARRARALSEPRVHGRRVHHGAARRERAHPDRQSGDAPRAHDDPRGDDARVLGAAPRAAWNGRRRSSCSTTRASASRCSFPGASPTGASGRRSLLWRSIPLLAAKLAVGRRRARADRDACRRNCACSARPEFLAIAFLLAVLGLLVHLLLGA